MSHNKKSETKKASTQKSHNKIKSPKKSSLPLKYADIFELINDSSCFDLQFRIDVKRKRKNQPAYYHWKTRFLINTEPEKLELLKKLKKVIGCGKIYSSGLQSQYSVQDIDELKNILIQFIKKYSPLSSNKQRDFKLWEKAVNILYKNKGKRLLAWKKSDFKELIDIQKKIQKYKERGKAKAPKWQKTANAILKSLS